MFNVHQTLVDLIPENMKNWIQQTANHTFMAGLYFVHKGYGLKYGPEKAQKFAEKLVHVAKYDEPGNNNVVRKLLFSSKIAAQASLFLAGASYRNLGGVWTPVMFGGLAWVAISPSLMNRNQIKQQVIHDYSPTLTWTAKAKDAVDSLRLNKRPDEAQDSITDKLTGVVQYFIPGFSM